MTEETVAAVVITFQRRDMLRQTLEGLREQERPVDEIVVIDNGTTDGTAGHAPAGLPRRHPPAHGGEHRPGRRPPGRFEYAHGKGHRWAWTHSDDILARPEALKTLLATAEQLGDDRLGSCAAGSSRSAPTTSTTAHSGRHRVVQRQWPPGACRRTRPT